MSLSAAPTTAYDAAQFDDNFPAGVENHFWFQARNRALHAALRAASARGDLPPSPALLEVGCGPGVVVAALRARGHAVVGAELGTPPRLLAPAHIAVGTRAASLPAPLREGIDGLLFLDVLEHVPDAAALLREHAAAFPRARAVVVTVPARPRLWSAHDVHYGHFRRYTPATLADALEAGGFRPRRVRYLFRALWGAAVVMKLAGRERDPVMAAPRSPALHRGLAAVLSAEDALLGASPLPGLSLLAVATRA